MAKYHGRRPSMNSLVNAMLARPQHYHEPQRKPPAPRPMDIMPDEILPLEPGTYWRTYDTMKEIVDDSDRAWRAGSRYDSLMSERGGWIGRLDLMGDNGEQTWKKVKEACTVPYKPELDEVMKMLNIIENERHNLPQPIDRRRQRRWSQDDGDEVDYDRLRSGQEFFRDTHREHVPGPQFLTLMANITTSACHDAGDILWRGATAIVIADMLERVGYRTEIWAIDCCRGAYHGVGSFIAVKLKGADDAIDIAQVSNGVSGWFYRSILGFQAMHCRPMDDTTPYMTRTFSYGGPVEITPQWAARLAGPGSKAVLIDEIWNLEKALEGCRTIINRMNDGSINSNAIIRTYDRHYFQGARW